MMSYWVMVNPELGSGRSIASLNPLPHNWLIFELSSMAGQYNTEVYLLGCQICKIHVHWLPLRISNDEVDDWVSTYSDKIESIIYEHSEAAKARGLLTGSAESAASFGKEWKKRISLTTVK